MKNGLYELVIAPPEYPGVKYRGRYVYEHHLVWWQNTGQLVPPGFLLHHKDENKRRNVIDNLELKSVGQHTADHNRSRAKLVHGTLNAYQRHKCRCDVCREKYNTHCNEYRWRTGRRKRRVLEGRPLEAVDDC